MSNPHTDHILPVSVYLRTFAALMALLILTLAAAHLPMGTAVNSAVAFTIALAKALIVVLYFMHVRFGTRLTWVWAAAGFFWLIIMFTITLSDYVFRSLLRVQGW
jgi:cytochrome c oxidase subunit 4